MYVLCCSSHGRWDGSLYTRWKGARLTTGLGPEPYPIVQIYALINAAEFILILAVFSFLYLNKGDRKECRGGSDRFSVRIK